MMGGVIYGSWAILVLVSSMILDGQHTTYGFNDYTEEDYRRVFPNNEDSGTLKMVTVIFRHGNRTISEEEQYPLDPYFNKTYFPYGLGQLTRTGKIKEYYVGTELRNRYNNFLGKYYYPELVEATTTDTNRTKMSLQLVLAGLFPPRKDEMILDIPWQPIPYNFLPRSEDPILSGIYCPKYVELYNQYISRPSVQKKITKYEELFKYLSEHTGLDVKTFNDVYELQFGIATEEEYGLVLPDWTKSVWPEPLRTLAVEEYFIAMGTADMRKLAVGFFLQKLLDDAKAKISDTKKLSTKIHLYSAHENNLAELLLSLAVFEKHVPTYGSYIIVELHQIRGVYGFKVFYEAWDGRGLRLMQLPRCNEFCPISVFTSLIEEYLPTDFNMCRL